MRMSHEMYDKVFGAVYLGMMGNLLVSVACAPVLIVLFTTDPVRSWPLLVVLAPVCAPAVVAAFSMFAHFSEEGPIALARTFARAWLCSFRRAIGLGALGCLASAVLSVDIVWAGRSHRLAILIPLLAVLDVLVVATTLLAWVGLAERPDERVRDIVRPAVYLAVRRWYLTLLSVLVAGLLSSVVAARPIIGLGFAVAPMLYVVWANGRFTLQPILHGART
jgi:uncharacterized membrane protein YesL